MSRKTELITLIVTTIVISILTVSSVLESGLWKVSTLCFIGAVVCLAIGWIKFYRKWAKP